MWIGWGEILGAAVTCDACRTGLYILVPSSTWVEAEEEAGE